MQHHRASQGTLIAIFFQNTERTGDRWYREYLDIPAGDYVIGFEAIATSAQHDPGIAIDDVQLLAGECQVQGEWLRLIHIYLLLCFNYFL